MFDGLLPEPHNGAVLKLLFLASHWHALAKLRMHTGQTLEIFDTVTQLLGAEFLEFKNKTCSQFSTRELPRESAARKRRVAKTQARSDPSQPENNDRPELESRLPKTLNLDTYKHHSLGDYPNIIRRYGTTDSYSTEPVRLLSSFPLRQSECVRQGELEHRTPKARYKRTDRKNFVKQLTQIERRQTRLRRIMAKIPIESRHQRTEKVDKVLHEHHRIGLSQQSYVHIGTFLRTHAGDPATKVRGLTEWLWDTFITHIVGLFL